MTRKPPEPGRHFAVADYLRDQIVSGGLKVGDLIPTVVVLADKFDVSSSTASKGVRVLVLQGLVASRGSQGTRVVSDVVPERPVIRKTRSPRALSELVDLLNDRVEFLESRVMELERRLG